MHQGRAGRAGAPKGLTGPKRQGAVLRASLLTEQRIFRIHDRLESRRIP